MPTQGLEAGTSACEMGNIPLSHPQQWTLERNAESQDSVLACANQKVMKKTQSSFKRQKSEIQKEHSDNKHRLGSQHTWLTGELSN